MTDVPRTTEAERTARDRWNSQADQLNRWDALSGEEKRELIEKEAAAIRLIDDMLAAQSRLAQAWGDIARLADQQRKDEAARDAAREALLKMVGGAS